MLEPITRRHKMCASFVLVSFKFEYGTHFGVHLLLITHILGKVINQRLWIAMWMIKNIRVLSWNWKRWEDFWSMRRMVTFRYKHLFEQNQWTHIQVDIRSDTWEMNQFMFVTASASASASSRYYNEWLYILYILGNIKWNRIRIYFPLNLLKSIELQRKN